MRYYYLSNLENGRISDPIAIKVNTFYRMKPLAQQPTIGNFNFTSVSPEDRVIDHGIFIYQGQSHGGKVEILQRRLVQ